MVSLWSSVPGFCGNCDEDKRQGLYRSGFSEDVVRSPDLVSGGVMITKTIRSSWWEGFGYRLDCQPYLAGALETKILLDRIALPKEPLGTLTTGHEGGIYNGPQFRRVYVESAEFGVPFVGSSSMLYSDFSHLPYLSKDEAHSNRLKYLELRRGMSLISC